MKHENLHLKERNLTDAALTLDKQMTELKEERKTRFERILSDVEWLMKEYEPRMDGMRNARSKIFSDLYQLRETMSQIGTRRRGKHEK